MKDVVWVALISAGAALITAILTQWLAIRSASKQAQRAEKREALQWERAQAEKDRELHDARLRELWGHVLTSRARVMDMLARVPVKDRPQPAVPDVPFSTLPESAAAQAYAVTLLGLAAVRADAKAYYLATSKLQLALQAMDAEQITDAAGKWMEAYKALENSVAALSDSAGAGTGSVGADTASK